MLSGLYLTQRLDAFSQRLHPIVKRLLLTFGLLAHFMALLPRVTEGVMRRFLPCDKSCNFVYFVAFLACVYKSSSRLSSLPPTRLLLTLGCLCCVVLQPARHLRHSPP
jgi:hypothetical protein